MVLIDRFHSVEIWVVSREPLLEPFIALIVVIKERSRLTVWRSQQEHLFFSCFAENLSFVKNYAVDFRNIQSCLCWQWEQGWYRQASLVGVRVWYMTGWFSY